MVPQTFEKVRWVYGKPLYTDVPKQELLSDLSNAQAFKKGKTKWTLSTEVPNHQSFLRDNRDYSELECLLIQQNILKVEERLRILNVPRIPRSYTLEDKIAMTGRMLKLAEIVL